MIMNILIQLKFSSELYIFIYIYIYKLMYIRKLS